MTDIREQVKNALMTVTKNVKMSKPSGDVELPLICYAETSNVSVNIAHDRVKYRVAVYADSFEELVKLMVESDMAKVASEDAAMKVRTNLAEYLEKGIVK